MNKDTVYLAGKITGDAGYRAKFTKARGVLENFGFIVLDPSFLPSEGLTYEAYIRIGAAMLDACASICLLPDWKESDGALREYKQALQTGKTVNYYADFWRAFNDPIGEGERDAE